MKIPFTKMQGLGNDFVVLDQLDGGLGVPIDSTMAARICDRRFGVGADQVLILKRAQDPSASVRMEILNADGSVAEMCGNGIRAVALYMKNRRSETRERFQIETLAGLKTVELLGDQVSVDMGPPVLGAGFKSEGEELRLGESTIRFYEVGMGNPHAVLFVNAPGQYTIERVGSGLERHPRFPDRTNVEFVHVAARQRLEVDVWERGAGRTLACGTGACAAAVAALATGRVEGDIEVVLPGGSLRIGWAGLGASVIMTGPAREVFCGEWNSD